MSNQQPRIEDGESRIDISILTPPSTASPMIRCAESGTRPYDRILFLPAAAPSARTDRRPLRSDRGSGSRPADATDSALRLEWRPAVFSFVRWLPAASSTSPPCTDEKGG